MVVERGVRAMILLYPSNGLCGKRQMEKLRPRGGRVLHEVIEPGGDRCVCRRSLLPLVGVRSPAECSVCPP